MDKELEDLLKEAHSMGASEADLDGIVGAFKKKIVSSPVSKGGVGDFGVGSNPFQPSVNTATPSVLTDKGEDVYKEQVIASQTKKQKLSDDINVAKSAYLSAQGEDIVRDIEMYQANPDAFRETENNTWLGNALKQGSLQGELANTLPVGKSPTPEELEKIAGLNYQSQRIPQSDAQKRYEVDGLGVFKDPILGAQFLTETIASSIASLYESAKRTVPTAAGIGAGAGALIGGVGALPGAGTGVVAGLSVAGLNLSTSGSIMKSLTDSGIDITDKDALIKAFSNESKMSEVRTKALKYGVPIMVFDVAAGGIAGKLISGAAGKSVARKFVAGLGEVAIQSVGGAGGELVGQVASGQDVDWNEVGVEAIASIATDAPDIVIGALGRNKSSSNNKNIVTQIVTQGVDTGSKDAQVNLDRDLANGVITPEEHQEGVEYVEKVKTANEKIPDTIEGEKREKSIEIITEKDDLIAELETLKEQKNKTDEAYHKSVDEKIETLEAKRQSLNDNIVEVTTDEKYSYSVDPESGKYFKQLGEDGKPEEITEQQYKLEKQVAPKVEVVPEPTQEQIPAKDSTPFKMYDRDMGVLGKDNNVADENIFLLDEKTGDVTLNKEGYEYGYSDPRYYWGDLFNIDFDLGDKPDFKDLQIVPAKIGNNGKVVQKGTLSIKEQSSKANQTFEQSTEIPTEQTNLDSKPQDDLLLDGEQVTGEPTNTDTAVETNQGAGAINQVANNPDVSEVGGEAVNEGAIEGTTEGVSTVLQKAETDLAALKQVENKTAKYEGSVKRLTEAKNAGTITESEFNDLLNRFDDVMAEYTPKGAKSVNLNESIPDEVLDDVEVPKEVKQYHAKEKDRAVADIKAQWAKLSVVGIANNPIQQDKDVAKLIEAVSRYAYHAMMDGSIKIKGKVSDKVDEIIRQLGIEKVTKQQREAITEAIKVQVEKTKAELKEFAKPIKTVIKESTQVKSDFKEKDLISRLSQFKRRLADEVRGFKKGVKEGKSDAKEKQQSKDDIISGLREEIKLQIKEAKDSGLISNRIKPQTFVGAINRLNNAKTPMQLLKAIDYMSRVFADIDYDNHLIEANNLRSKVKKLAKRKGLPSNISEAMRNIARAVPEDLDDLIEYNKLLNSVIDNVNGASITGIDTGLLNDVANWLAEQHQKKTKERYELLVGEQGFEYESKTLEEMKAEIDALNEEDYEGKDSRRDADVSVSELLREDLLDADVSDYDHPQEVAAIEALKSLDISELSDKDLRLFNIAVNNLLLNGKLNGIGTLISVARKQKNFADKAKIADIQATTRAVSSWADKFRSGWATLPTQLKAFINNDRNLAKFYTITGLAEIKTGYTRVSNRITEVEKGIEKIIRKHKELRDVPKRQIEVAVYADLNQWDEGSTQEQIQEQFDGRKTALLETIDRLKEKSSFDVKFKKEHSNYIGLLEDVYDSIKGLKSVNDLTLQPGQMELYNYMRDYYDSIQDDTRLNAEIYNNINFKPVQNYFPRTYNKVDDLFGANAEKQMESKLLSESIFYDRSDIKKEESGSKQSRVIKKDQLPIDKVINLDLVSNFLNTARNVLYDIETQPARTYTANLLASKQMRELTTDDSSIEITQRVANQLVKNQRLGILPQHSKTAAKAMGEFYRGMGNRFALGGISQAVKQSASSYTTTMIALGKNAGLLATSVHELIVNNEAANRLMEGMPISRRALEKSALTHVSIKESDVSKLNRSMEKHIVRVLDGWNDFADFMSLSPLIWGDLVSAKASWMAFYKDYLIKEGIIKSPSEFNLEKESLSRNVDAAEYAEQMTNTTLNSNDRTLQPEQKLGGWFPFTSFAINAKLNLAIDMARVSRKGIPIPERQKAARMVAGHIASSVVLNAISWGLRAYLITEAVDLVANFVKDDEEEEERDVLVKYLESLQDELLVRNSENTVGYIIKDIVFGGIISQVTDPVYNTIKEWITGEKSYDRPSDLIKIAGIYGIPASAIIQLGTKANDLMLPDEQFRKERYGIKSADGSILYVPIESRDKKRSEWARKSMASATALNALQVLSSVSNQEFANISRRLPLLVKKLEDKKYGSKRSLNPKNIEKDMAEITLDGKTYILSSEQIEFRKKSKAEFLKDNYKTIKENGTDKESEQLAKSLSDTYATNLTLYEFRDKLKEKE